MSLSKVTIQTVADLAKVSIKTVSRVINKEASVRDSTREKVLAVIAELGYKPSPAARALAANTSKIIGLIYDNPSAAYVMDVQTGVLKSCYAEGYNLVIHPCDHESPDLGEELVNLVQKSRLGGLILTPPICEKMATVNALLENNINVVNIAPSKISDRVSSVSGNDAQMVEEITINLIEQGHTHIGFVYGHVDHGAAHQRFAGYQEALREYKIPVRDDLIVQGDFSFESGVECGKKLLQLKDRPSAIFASNDYMAAGVLKVAKNMNLDVPGDLSLVGYDDAPVSRQIWPSLSTVKQPIQQMSECAARLLIKKIIDPKIASEHHVFESELLFRESIQANKEQTNSEH